MIDLKNLENDRMKLRQKVITKGRTEINRKMRDGSYVDWLRKEHGVMDEKDLLLDNEFLDDIIKEIERNRAKKLVYTQEYKKEEYNKWLDKRDRKILLREIAEKAKKIES